MFATPDERTTVLRMIDEQKITANQGAQLLAAMGKSASQPVTPKADLSNIEGRTFHVLVTDLEDKSVKVSVTIPLKLVRWGLKVGKHYSPDMEGIDMDELADLLASGEIGKIVEVIDEEDKEHVQVFVE